VSKPENALMEVLRDALVVPLRVRPGKSSLAFGTLYAEAQRRYLLTASSLCAATDLPGWCQTSTALKVCRRPWLL
jgi:excinuclease UvrABC ATPase subunit